MNSSNGGSAASAGAIYGLGIIGGWVYFWQHAHGFGHHLWAIVQGLVWPAYLVYDLFRVLQH